MWSSQRIVDLGTDNRDQLRAAVADYEPVGWTPTSYALRQAAEDLGDTGQRTVVLVSDGEPTCSPDPCKVAAEIARTGIDIRIDVVGLDVTGKARRTLQCVAEEGNGTYYDATDADELASSLSTSATRSSRPFDFMGSPIEGSSSPESAPALATGLRLDTFPSGDSDLWYRVPRTAPGSTLHVGVTHRSTQIGNSGEGVTIDVYTPPGTASCGYQASSFARGSLGYAATTSASRNQDECATADDLYVKVAKLRGGDRLTGTPLQIAMYEEPPVAGATPTAQASAPESSWTPIEPGSADSTIIPGTSLTNAPVVAPGTYALDVNPGETQAVAVPVDWGQSLQAQLDARVRRPSSLDHNPPEIQITGPLGEAVAHTFTDTALSSDWTPYGSLEPEATSDYRWGRQTNPVAFENRFSYEPEINGSTVPGLRYVLVSLPETFAQPMRYTLTVRTNGTAGDGAPTYAQVAGLTPPAADSPLSVPTAGGAVVEPSPAQSSQAEADENPSGSSGSALPWIAAGAVLLVAGSAGWLLLRTRRGER